MVTLPEQEAKLRTTPEPSQSMVNTWYKKLLENDQIFVLQAQNEQDPITEEELQLPIRPMPTVDVSGHLQVADYHFFIDGHSGTTDSKYGSFIVERKSIADLYGTLFSFNTTTKEKQRERLYREIQRFYEDDRFDQFIVMVEGSYKEFLRYVPLADRMSTTGYWLKVESMLNSKKSTINSLNVRPGVKVIFCDSREDMVERFRDMIRQWVIHNFEEVMENG
jgi:ERCC4-type nuclease